MLKYLSSVKNVVLNLIVLTDVVRVSQVEPEPAKKGRLRLLPKKGDSGSAILIITDN